MAFREKKSSEDAKKAVSQLAFYHGNIDATIAAERLKIKGDYLLRIHPDSGQLMLTIHSSNHTIIDKVLTKTAENGTAYRLPKAPHAKTETEYIAYFVEYNIGVLPNVFLRQAVRRPMNERIGGSDKAIILPIDYKKNWLLPGGMRPIQELPYYHGVLDMAEAMRRCTEAGESDHFLLWTDVHDGVTVLSVSGDGGRHGSFTLKRAANDDGSYTFQLPEPDDVAQTEEEFINYYLFYSMPFYENYSLVHPILAPHSFRKQYGDLSQPPH